MDRIWCATYCAFFDIYIFQNSNSIFLTSEYIIVLLLMQSNAVSLGSIFVGFYMNSPSSRWCTPLLLHYNYLKVGSCLTGD